VLFVAFLRVGLSGFGGVLPFARRALVERRGWLSEADFNETLALCQSLPGPNVLNLSVVVGSRFAGARGALASVVGLVAAPVALVLALASLWSRYGAMGRAPAAIAGLAAAASGLVVATVVKMARPTLAAGRWAEVLVMAIAFATVGLLRAPLPLVLLALAPPSVGLAWRAQRRRPRP
jgi:chromate transporter